MGSTGFRNSRALSIALASLGALQPRALGFLKPVDPLVSVSNLYVYDVYFMPYLPIFLLKMVGVEDKFTITCKLVFAVSYSCQPLDSI